MVLYLGQGRTTHTGPQVPSFSLRIFKTQIHCLKTKAFLCHEWEITQWGASQLLISMIRERIKRKCSVRPAQGNGITRNSPGRGWKLCKNVKQSWLVAEICAAVNWFWTQGKRSLLSLLGCLYHREMLLNPSTEQQTCSSQQAELWKLGQKMLTHFPSRKDVFQNDLSCPIFHVLLQLCNTWLWAGNKVWKKSLARAKQMWLLHMRQSGSPHVEQSVLFHFKARMPLPQVRGTSSCLNNRRY